MYEGERKGREKEVDSVREILGARERGGQRELGVGGGNERGEKRQDRQWKAEG